MDNQNLEVCKKCGGECCKGAAGLYIPEDFKQPITPELIVSLLVGGKVSLDWWHGDPTEKPKRKRSRTYYVRPRQKGEGAIHGSWGGECINLTENGCSLPFSARPFQCREVIPNEDWKKCGFAKDVTAEKKDCIITWYNFQRVLDAAVKRFYYIKEKENEGR